MNVKPKPISVRDLRKKPAKKPQQAGAYFRPTKHHELCLLLEEALCELDWEVTERVAFVTPQGGDLVALYDIQHPRVATKHILVALRASNERRCTPRIYTLLETSPGAYLVIDELVLFFRLTRKSNLKEVFLRAADNCLTEAMGAPVLVHRFKHKKIPLERARRLIWACAKAKLFPWSKLKYIDKEIYDKNYHSLWKVLTSVAKHMHSITPFTRFAKTFALLRILDPQEDD